MNNMLDTFEKKVIAEILKQADCINSKTEFAKIVYYLIAERGVKLNLDYSQDFPQGSYSPQFNDILKELVADKLAIVEEHKTPKDKQRFAYCASAKLQQQDVALDDPIKLKIKSILREYKTLGYLKMVQYDHEIYKDKSKVRMDRRLKELRRELDDFYISKSGGEEEKETDLILFNTKQRSAPSWIR